VPEKLEAPPITEISSAKDRKGMLTPEVQQPEPAGINDKSEVNFLKDCWLPC